MEEWMDNEDNLDLADEKIDGMSPWEVGFEEGVMMAEEELFDEE